MKNLLSASAAIALLSVLGACLGSDESMDISASAINSLFERADGATEVTDAADLNGTAIMSGIIGVSFENEDDEMVLGDMNVTAKFDTSEMAGTATNLGVYDVTGTEERVEEAVLIQSLDGELSLVATISGVTFTGNMDGTIAGDYAFEDQVFPFVVDVDVAVNGGFAQDVDGLLMAGADVSGTGVLTVTTDEGEFEETLGLDGEFLVGE